MKLDEVSVFITDEVMLKEAKKLLKTNGQYVSKEEFGLSDNIMFNYLQMDVMTEEWFVGVNFARGIVSLTELKELFNELNSEL